MARDLSRASCPYCHSAELAYTREIIHDDAIDDSGIQCASCKRTYPIIWGVPFIGSYDEQEILSLLEIASTTGQYNRNTENQRPIKLDYINWISTIDDYCQHLDLEEVKKRTGLKEVPDWFWNRYAEQIQFNYLTQYIPLNGKMVLDVGAGSGYDSLKYAVRGAKVTSLEFNPALFGTGHYNYPELNWIGGSSHNLPFQDESFDVVVANAALHHMVNIPVTISEMLRVLKPGGALITMSDSYCHNNYTEEDEARIFNTHTAVLTGINERVPHLKEFVSPLEAYKDNLSIRVFTQTCYDFCPHPREWSFDESLRQLPHTSGSIAFYVKKERSFPVPRRYATQSIIDPAAFAHKLYDPTTATSILVDLIPKQYTDLELLDNEYAKFRLLNGWQLPLKNEKKRGAYGRARMFYSIDKLRARQVSLGILAPYQEKFTNPLLRVKINNQVLFEQEIIRGCWSEICCPLSGATPGSSRNIALELEMKLDSDVFEARQFYVNRIEFTDTITAPVSFSIERLEMFGLETIMQAGVLGQSVSVLFSRDVNHGIDIVNRLRKKSLKVNCSVPAGQQAFYSWMPGISVHRVYDDSNGKMLSDDKIPDVRLLVAGDVHEALKLSALIARPDDVIVVYPKGYAELLVKSIEHERTAG